jgi:hypothetical protein
VLSTPLLSEQKKSRHSGGTASRISGRPPFSDQLLTHPGLDQGVAAHLEPLAEHRVGAFRGPGSGVAMPVVELGYKDRLAVLLRLVVGIR